MGKPAGDDQSETEQMITLGITVSKRAEKWDAAARVRPVSCGTARGGVLWRAEVLQAAEQLSSSRATLRLLRWPLMAVSRPCCRLLPSPPILLYRLGFRQSVTAKPVSLQRHET